VKYFLSFKIFEQLHCACPEKHSCPEVFHCIEIFFSFRIFEQLTLALKTVCPEVTLLDIYFLSFRIFEQLALALKTEISLKFFKTGLAAALPDLPPRTPICLSRFYAPKTS